MSPNPPRTPCFLIVPTEITQLESKFPSSTGSALNLIEKPRAWGHRGQGEPRTLILGREGTETAHVPLWSLKGLFAYILAPGLGDTGQASIQGVGIRVGDIVAHRATPPSRSATPSQLLRSPSVPLAAATLSPTAMGHVSCRSCHRMDPLGRTL